MGRRVVSVWNGGGNRQGKGWGCREWVGVEGSTIALSADILTEDGGWDATYCDSGEGNR